MYADWVAHKVYLLQGEEKVKTITMASTGLELKSQPRYRKSRCVASTPWPVLVRDVLLRDIG